MCAFLACLLFLTFYFCFVALFVLFVLPFVAEVVKDMDGNPGKLAISHSTVTTRRVEALRLHRLESCFVGWITLGNGTLATPVGPRQKVA